MAEETLTKQEVREAMTSLYEEIKTIHESLMYAAPELRDFHLRRLYQALQDCADTLHLYDAEKQEA